MKGTSPKIHKDKVGEESPLRPFCHTRRACLSVSRVKTGLRGNQLEDTVFRETVLERHEGRTDLNQSAAHVHVGDIRHLQVADV